VVGNNYYQIFKLPILKLKFIVQKWTLSVHFKVLLVKSLNFKLSKKRSYVGSEFALLVITLIFSDKSCKHLCVC
jgi:hypothetical protein